MDSRFGAWPQLLALFRAIYFGCGHPDLHIPAREGYLFDPERFLFLEGNTMSERTIPLVSDGTIFRVLERLLLLEGERLSYRTLDVEHVGGVYETMMGFQMERAAGLSVSLKATKAHGAPTTVNLDALLSVGPADKSKWLQENADTTLTPVAADALKKAQSIDDLLVALEKRIARGVTPHPVPPGAMILQPSEERRRTGSHYTPRTLTEPIVRKALEPILTRLGVNPRPDQILALKIADISVGSGAFLVEACRQLAEALVAAWRYHSCTPPVPPDEDEVLLARRAIAQKCLYGVDRNPMAVDLTKLSIWLATLAKDHPFTFLDHSIRCGDSLAGLTRRQIGRFSWSDAGVPVQFALGQADLDKMIEAAAGERQKIIVANDSLSPHQKVEHLRAADAALELARIAGDSCISAFFDAKQDRARQTLREERALEFSDAMGAARRGDRSALDRISERLLGENSGQPRLRPFHWEIEFPEVFADGQSGFDAIVGNPPFVGGRRVREMLGSDYFYWLPAIHSESSGNADLVAHFFRRAFTLLRRDGCFGLIATNTISQGDTRHTGLRWICAKQGGSIYAARRRYKWPGEAAVVVSVVWVAKGTPPGPYDLDGKSVDRITAYLFHDGGHENPAVLQANANKSFIGSYILGMGFTFDEKDKKGVANSFAEMERLKEKNPRNAERIFPYLGGEEINDSPTHSHHRYVINFADFPLERRDLGNSWLSESSKQWEAWLRTGIVPLDYSGPVAGDWPDLLHVVEEKVRPERTRKKADGSFVLREPLPQRWWQFADKRPALTQALAKIPRALVLSRVGERLTIARVPTNAVFADSTVVFAFEQWSAIAVLQSRVHEAWARFFASSMKDDLRYTPSDCFETFPFCDGWEKDGMLESAGREYYEFRAELMVRNNEGLTKTYNRFHDPDEVSEDIEKLRQLHAVMDVAVLNAYSWDELVPQCSCQFILEYEEEEDASSSKRKRPYRYRWPAEIRDQVLARLLKLNAEQAEAERVLAMSGSRSKSPKKRLARSSEQPNLI